MRATVAVVAVVVAPVMPVETTMLLEGARKWPMIEQVLRLKHDVTFDLHFFRGEGRASLTGIDCFWGRIFTKVAFLIFIPLCGLMKIFQNLKVENKVSPYKKIVKSLQDINSNATS